MPRRWIPVTIPGLVIAWTLLWVPVVAQSPGSDGSAGPDSLAATSAALEMRSVALPADLPHAVLTAIVAGGPGYIAVGATENFGAEPDDSLILTSPDGLTWTPVDSIDLLGTKLVDVTAYPGGYVAVGHRWVDDAPNDAIAFVSVDGLTWQPASTEGLASAEMYGVTPWADGVAAIGAALDDDGVWARSLVFTSANGVDWTRHRLPASITDPKGIGAGDGLLAVLDLISTHEGARDVERPVVATSTDLETWTRRELDFHGELRSVVVDGDHVIAAGSVNDARGRSHGVLVYSPNAGRRWVRQPVTTPAGSSFSDISLAGPVIASGSTWHGADQENAAAAWTSTVGMDWRQVPADAGDQLGWIEDFAAFPDRVGGIAVGPTGADYDRPAVWAIEAH